MLGIDVLVIEDTDSLRKLFVRHLHSLGLHCVDEAADGHLGLVSLKTHKYDIAFIDEHMPTMNGTECLKKYREFERATHTTSPTTCVIVSADAVPVQGTEADDFISKPVNWNKVKEVVQGVSSSKMSSGHRSSG
eukprot:3504-Heterococcus_DN1.PRE.1